MNRLANKVALSKGLNTPYSVYQIRWRTGTRSRSRKELGKFLRRGNQKFDSSSVEIPKEVNEPLVDFVSTNTEIRSLVEGSTKRMLARYSEPNIYWKNSLNIEANTPYQIRKELEERFGGMNTHFRPIDILSRPLDLGDIVELNSSFEKSELCCVVELPTSILDPRYAFANNYGDIIFASKSSVSMRLPGVVPKQWLKDFVLNERLFKLRERGIKQIGKPKFLTEDSTIHSSTKSFFEQALINNGHDLKHLDTFVLPLVLSQSLARDLNKIIIDAWDLLPTMSAKLELVHNLLQDSESAVVINIFQLLKALDSINIDKAELNIQQLESYDDLIQYYSELSKRICNEISMDHNYESSMLGKSVIGEFDLFRHIEIVSFYSMVLALRRSDKLFDGVNNPDRATQFPLSVTILPLSRTVEQDFTIDFFKETPASFDSLISHLEERLTCFENQEFEKLASLPKPQHYDQVISLMKLYCSSSTRLYKVTESFILKIFRSISVFNSQAISPSLVYETLYKLGEREKIQNPVEWSIDLLKPYSGISEKSDIEQNVYDQLIRNDIRADDTVDLASNLRQSFDDDIIYCIDNRDAHEIDDGVSIVKLQQDLYKINTYVADPASYLTPDDMILKIAFERASTVYFPDSETAPIEMLPKSIVREAELRPGKQTRVMRFSFLYDASIKSFVENSLEVEPGFASKFLNVTYEDVDRILDGDNSILNRYAQLLGLPADHVKEDLLKLYEASANMKQSREQNSSFDFKFPAQLESVSRPGNDDHQIHLTFKDQTDISKSQTLVSEIMIHTNALTARFFKQNEIPAIYRVSLRSPMNIEVEAQMQSLEKTSLADTQKQLNFMAGTSFSLFPLKHEYIGLGPYSTVTSPLRRFQDLFSHWQLVSFLQWKKKTMENNEIIAYKDLLMFSESNVAYILCHISSRNHKLKQIAHKSKNFFIFKKLNELPKSTKFRVMIRSRPFSNGEVEGILLDYASTRCILKSSVVFSNKKLIEDLEDSTNQNLNTFTTLKIGEIIEDCLIKDIDLLTGDLLMESASI